MAYEMDDALARTHVEFHEFFDDQLEDALLDTESQKVQAPYATFADYVRSVRALCDELLAEVRDE